MSPLAKASVLACNPKMSTLEVHGNLLAEQRAGFMGDFAKAARGVHTQEAGRE